MSSIAEFFAREDAYPELDCSGAAARLSGAVQCRTVNCADHSLTDYSEFDRLHELVRQSFPSVMSVGKIETPGSHALLIEIPGSDPSLRPCLYMAHQDVVPVVDGTEDDWEYPPFSGAIAGGHVWGRGTLDIKQQMFGILEAAEYLLSHGASFRRTAYLAFGDDEETLNEGALAIAQALRSRGVRLEFLLDEGGCKIESGEAFGAPETNIINVSLMEKGYADLRLFCAGAGGHSSKPFGGTTLEHIAQAISDITRSPFETRLSSVMTGAFRALAPFITQEPLRTLVADIDANSSAIAEYCRSCRELFPYVVTTAAPTVIHGGSEACNVMPQNMEAVINFRIAEGDTAASVFEHCRNAVRDERISMEFLQANDPSTVARTDGPGYAALTKSFGEFFKNVVFVPTMTVGATDAHQYESICDTCLRCSPFMAEPEECMRGVHGTNERITIRAYIQGIRVMIRMMEIANVSPEI